MHSHRGSKSALWRHRGTLPWYTKFLAYNQFKRLDCGPCLASHPSLSANSDNVDIFNILIQKAALSATMLHTGRSKEPELLAI